ncbi:MAG TPA: heparan-alpha-glucosaminide N-acetyltransferase domain-containing protein [Armatimonadota bacterium]|jgi:predicted acyltransferase
MVTEDTKQNLEPDPPAAPPAERRSAVDAAPPTPGSQRLLCLDALRGLTIAAMLLVNNVSLDTATPVQLTHAPWNGGVRLADFVFPWFLFCVGVAIPFSMAAAKRRNTPAWRTDLRILQRGATLVALGCLIESSFAKRPVFALGVLQIIGLAYVVGALLYELPASRRILISAVILAGYWAALKLVPFPGAAPGVFEEGRNFVRHINDAYLRPVGLAGLPSVAPTSALVLIATVVGDALRAKGRSPAWKIGVLAAVGALLTLSGVLWAHSLGYNKAVWTPSYILLMAGSGSLMLGGLYAVMDAGGIKAWAYPLLVFGSNAIVAYVAPILVKAFMLQEWRMWTPHGRIPVQDWLLSVCVQRAGRVGGGWAYTVGYIGFWWCVLWLLYRKKVFLRV